MEKQYYAPEEVMKILNKSRSTFYREVEDGTIPSELPEGRKRGRKFPREAIDALVEVTGAATKEEHWIFTKSTNADIWQRCQNSRRIYGENDYVTYKRTLEWLKTNPDIMMSAKDDKTLFGGATILPVDEGVIWSVSRDEIREDQIPASAIKKWTDSNLSAYILTIAATKSDSAVLDTRRGAFLIKNTIRWAISLQLQHDIKNWYGIGVTPKGQALLEALGFKLALSVQNGARKTYRLDNIAQGSRMLKAFLSSVDRKEIYLDS